MQKTLTAKNVTTLPAPKSGQVEYADKTLPGFGLRVSSAGVRAFYLTYRPTRGTRKGRLTRWTLGRLADEFGLAEARDIARNAKIAIRDNGADPAHDGKQEDGKAGDSYSEVVELFIRQYAKPRQRTWKETERVLKSLPWGTTPIGEITKADARKHIRGLVEKGKYAPARVTLSWLKTLWRWAWRQELVEFPIMDALKADDFGIISKVRKRTYSDKEIKALWNAKSDKLTSHEIAYLKLSILLAPRAGVLAKMCKAEINEELTIWEVPVERVKTSRAKQEAGTAKPYIYPLPPLAQRILKPLLKDLEADYLVFESNTVQGVAMDPDNLAAKVREATKIEDWYHHAHRDTAATWLGKSGYDDFDQKLLLKHATATGATIHYGHGFAFERCKQVTEAWADHVASVVAPKGAELLA